MRNRGAAENAGGPSEGSERRLRRESAKGNSIAGFRLVFASLGLEECYTRECWFFSLRVENCTSTSSKSSSGRYSSDRWRFGAKVVTDQCSGWCDVAVSCVGCGAAEAAFARLVVVVGNRRTQAA